MPLVTAEASWLAAMLLVAAMLRLAGLDWQPLWTDEAATAGFASLPWSELLHGVGQLEPNPPGFYMLESLWTSAVGASDFALRLPSVAFGVAGVAVVWALARAAGGSRAAIAAAGLAAIDLLLIDHSRDARVYALFFLTVGLVALLGRRIATSAPGATPWRATIGLAVLSALSFWLHHTAAIAMVAAYAYAGMLALHRPGPRLRRLVMLAAAAAAGLLLSLPSLLQIMAVTADKANNAGWIPAPDAYAATILTVATWTSTLDGIRLLPAPLPLAALAAGFVVVTYALVWAAGQMRRSADMAGLLTATILSVVVLAGISQFVPVFVDKTLLFSLVFFIPMLGCALAALPRAAVPALLVPVLVLQAPGLLTLCAATRHGDDWVGATAAIESEAARTDTAVALRSAFDAIALERYTQGPTAVRASVLIAPRLGTALNEEMARRLTHAVPISQQAPPASLCALLGRHQQLLLVDRDNAIMNAERHAATALLMSAGGVETGESYTGKLIIQHWRGVCAAPAGPTVEPAAAPSRPPPPSVGN
jgi:mannosyltransferase